MKKAIVITTINKPNDYIRFYSSAPDWDLIIVADKKTPAESYSEINCIFLSISLQKDLFGNLSDLIPFNSYSRKMLGYLYCIKNNYDIIYETDDDNINTSLNYEINNTYLPSSNGVINIYNAYNREYDSVCLDTLIYPRGLPLNHECINSPLELEKLESVREKVNWNVSIIQGLVNGDPDIDAHLRLQMSPVPFYFKENLNKNVILPHNTICPFNTQNTFWIDKSMFYAMYLPITVNFRYTDILRSYVALHQLKVNGKHLMFTPPTAMQVRNQHDLQKDLADEQEMYNTASSVIQLILDDDLSSIVALYERLVALQVVRQEELLVLKEFINQTK